MKNSIHQEAFDLYEVFKGRTASKQKKEAVRKVIYRALEREFPGKKWYELTELERKRFLCITIKQKMLNHLGDQSSHSRIERKVDAYANRAFIEAEEALLEYNERAVLARVYFYPETDDENVKKRAYNDFRHALEKYFKYLPIPSFDQWVQENERALQRTRKSLRIYDYEKSYEFDHLPDETEGESYVSQQEIDHVILETVLKLLKDKFGFEIDVERIRKCLTIIQEAEMPDQEVIDERLTRYDDTLPIDRDKQQQIIAGNIEYMQCKIARENLDFIIQKDCNNK